MENLTAISTPRAAGFWRRVLAFLIDAALAGAGLYLVEYVVAQAWLATFASSYAIEQGLFWMGLAVFLLGTWLYSAGFESSPGGATPGKMAMGLRVARADGRALSFARASGRFLGKLLSISILGIGLLMAAWTKDHQALHDLIAGTVVEKI